MTVKSKTTIQILQVLQLIAIVLTVGLVVAGFFLNGVYGSITCAAAFTGVAWGVFGGLQAVVEKTGDL